MAFAIASFLSPPHNSCCSSQLCHRKMEQSSVTPSCNTAASAFVIQEICPIKTLEPKLYTIAIPILNKKKSGMMQESIVRERMILQRITAISTQIGVSLLDKFFVSVTTADIPLTKHWFCVTSRISSIASIVSSALVVVSNMAIIRVASPFANASCSSCGRSSVGMEISAKLSYQITFFTWSTSSTFSFSLETSLQGSPSVTIIVKAPVPKSSIRTS